jgi:hypothetical protein
MNSHLYNLLLSETSKDNWITLDDNKKILNFSCSPLKTNQPSKFSYVKISIEKDNNAKYKGSVIFETSKPFLKEIDEDEDSDDEEEEEINQMSFSTSLYLKLNKCITKTVELFESISICNSCNKIYQKNCTDLCSTCIIQLHYHKYKTQCSICYDDAAQLLPFTLPCDHCFHFACLTRMRNYKCPLCRREFKL